MLKLDTNYGFHELFLIHTTHTYHCPQWMSDKFYIFCSDL